MIWGKKYTLSCNFPQSPAECIQIAAHDSSGEKSPRPTCLTGLGQNVSLNYSYDLIRLALISNWVLDTVLVYFCYNKVLRSKQCSLLCVSLRSSWRTKSRQHEHQQVITHPHEMERHARQTGNTSSAQGQVHKAFVWQNTAWCSRERIEIDH